MNLFRLLGLVVALQFVALGLFLLLRGDTGDGFRATLIVGLATLGLGLVALVSTFAAGNHRIVPVVLLVIVACLPYVYLVGPSGIVLNLVLAALAAVVFWRGVRTGR